jgi:hypothetical protein
MAPASGVVITVDTTIASTIAGSKERGFESHFDHHFCPLCALLEKHKGRACIFGQFRTNKNNREQI